MRRMCRRYPCIRSFAALLARGDSFLPEDSAPSAMAAPSCSASASVTCWNSPCFAVASRLSAILALSCEMSMLSTFVACSFFLHCRKCVCPFFTVFSLIFHFSYLDFVSDVISRLIFFLQCINQIAYITI